MEQINKLMLYLNSKDREMQDLGLVLTKELTKDKVGWPRSMPHKEVLSATKAWLSSKAYVLGCITGEELKRKQYGTDAKGVSDADSS